MITVTFLNGCILATAEQSLWQYSYNQQLQINGLELPEVFTVDFCNEGDTTTVAMIGSDNVVDIPNELLISGRGIVAYVFQKSTLTGGITRCEIRIDVLTRPERDDETPTPEQEAVIDQYIAELNEGVEQAETAAANAQTSENNAAASAADAQQSKADAAASASAAAGSASDASNSAAAAAQSAVNASNSAENAAEAASEGIGYKEDSEAWAIGKRGGVDVGSSDETYHNNSKYYAGQAAASSSAANSEAAAAAQSARDAAASANGAAQSAASATASKNAAANSADIAAIAATAAQNHASNAAASATAASGSAAGASNSASAAAQSATEAGNASTAATTAKEAAEDAQEAAETAAQSVSQSAAQIATNTSDISDLKSAINDPATGLDTKAPIIINSASGAIASFADGADGLPVKALSVNVEPVQDLHGYDSPWSAGGGKNKLSLASLTLGGTESRTKRVEIDAIPAGTYIFTATNTGTETSIANYGLQFFDAATGGSNVGHTQNGTTFTLTGEAKSIYFYMNSDSYSDGKTVILSNMMVRLSSVSDATYAPYSNICPISGRTSATVTRTGKNLMTLSTVELGGTNPRTKSVSIGTIPPGTYRFSAVKSGTSTGTGDFGIQFFNDTALVGQISTVSQNVTLTDTANRVYAYMASGDYSDGKTLILSDIQLELGSTASAYEPYVGDTYAIQLGDTVYGGTLDVTGGKMVVDRVYAVLNNPDKWAEASGTVSFRYDVSFDSKKIYDNSYSGLTCSYVPCLYGTEPYGRWNSASGTYFCIKSSALTLEQVKTDAEAGKISIVYEIATPIEITLTPTQIDTLLGTNNIWSDAGPVDVDYRADTKLYVDKKIAAAIAAALNA